MQNPQTGKFPSPNFPEKSLCLIPIVGSQYGEAAERKINSQSKQYMLRRDTKIENATWKQNLKKQTNTLRNGVGTYKSYQNVVGYQKHTAKSRETIPVTTIPLT
jgi:hypothetical protein